MKKLFTFSSLLVFGLLQANEVDLYLEPSTDGNPIASIPANSPELANPYEVLDNEAAAAGWVWTESSQTLVGYVPDAKIGKDLFPVDGALIRLRPDNSAPVLSAVSPGDDIQVLDTGAWWEIQFTKTVPVYFIPRPVAVEPIVETVITEEMPAVGEGDSELMEILDMNIDAGYGPANEDRSVSPAYGLHQQFEGTFTTTTNRFGFISPKSDFELLDGQGRVVGAVNIEDMVIPDTLDKYNGHEVIIHGTRSYDAKKKQWVIYGVNMRLK